MHTCCFCTQHKTNIHANNRISLRRRNTEFRKYEEMVLRLSHSDYIHRTQGSGCVLRSRLESIRTWFTIICILEKWEFSAILKRKDVEAWKLVGMKDFHCSIWQILLSFVPHHYLLLFIMSVFYTCPGCRITSSLPSFCQNHIFTQKLVVWVDNGLPFILQRNARTHGKLSEMQWSKETIKANMLIRWCLTFVRIRLSIWSL